MCDHALVASNISAAGRNALIAGIAVGTIGMGGTLAVVHSMGAPPPAMPEQPTPTDVPDAPVEPVAPPEPEGPKPGEPLLIATHEDGHATAATFSPDGTRLAWEVQGRANTKTAFTATWSPKGPDTATEVLAATTAFTMADIGTPVWIPDGRLMFEVWERGARNSRLFAIDPTAGTGGMPFAPEVEAHPSAAGAAVSPDGKQLAWIADGDIYLWTIGAAAPAPLTATPEREDNLSFSPDGSRLLFSRGAMGQRDLMTLPTAPVEPGPDDPKPKKGEEDKPVLPQATPLAAGDGDQSQGAWLSKGVALLQSSGRGSHTGIFLQDGEDRDVIEADVRADATALVVVSPERDYLLYTPTRATDKLVMYRIADGKRIEIVTNVLQIDRPTLGTANGRRYIAYSGVSRDSTSKWKELWVLDVTDQL